MLSKVRKFVGKVRSTLYHSFSQLVHTGSVLEQIQWGYVEQAEEMRQHLTRNKALRELILKIAVLKKTDRVLDVGCGIGTVAKILGRYAGEIIGIDIDETSVEWGNAHWAKKSNCTLQLGNAYDIPFPDKSFDLVISFGLLEWLASPYRAIEEMMRVVKRPGIIMVLSISIQEYEVYPLDEIWRDWMVELARAWDVIGVDIGMTRLRAFCHSMQLPLEQFTYTGEYRTIINDELITLLKTQMSSFIKPASVREELIDFNYQFLKRVGWSKEKVRAAIEHQYNALPFIENIRQHKGEYYYKKMPIHIYRIQFQEE